MRFSFNIQVDIVLYVRVSFFNKGAGYRLVTLKDTQHTSRPAAFVKVLRTLFLQNKSTWLFLLTILLNSLFLIASARRCYLTGDMTKCYPFIQVRWNDHLENIPLMHRYGINTNILNLGFSRAEFWSFHIKC